MGMSVNADVFVLNLSDGDLNILISVSESIIIQPNPCMYFAIFVLVYKCAFSLSSEVMNRQDAGAVINEFEIKQYTS